MFNNKTKKPTKIKRTPLVRSIVPFSAGILFITFLFLLLIRLDRSGGVSPELREWRARGAQLVDVRTPQKFAAGRIEGAINIPEREIVAGFAALKIDHVAPVILYSSNGGESERARIWLAQAGYANVINGGGVKELKKVGFQFAVSPRQSSGQNITLTTSWDPAARKDSAVAVPAPSVANAQTTAGTIDAATLNGANSVSGSPSSAKSETDATEEKSLSTRNASSGSMPSVENSGQVMEPTESPSPTVSDR